MPGDLKWFLRFGRSPVRHRFSLNQGVDRLSSGVGKLADYRSSWSQAARHRALATVSWFHAYASLTWLPISRTPAAALQGSAAVLIRVWG